MINSYEYNSLSSSSPAYKCYGYVIKIVDENTIITSLSKESVSVGDLIEVYENLAEIIDPISNKYLGVYSVPIEEFIVIDIFSDYSVCKIYKRTYNVMTSFVNALNPLMDEDDDKLSSVLNPDQNELLKPSKHIISIKDPVRVSKGKFNYKNYI